MHKYIYYFLVFQRAICAFCTDRIWGLGRQGYKCINCKMLVHKKCHKLIQMPCGAAMVRTPLLSEFCINSLSFNQMSFSPGLTPQFALRLKMHIIWQKNVTIFIVSTDQFELISYSIAQSKFNFRFLPLFVLDTFWLRRPHQTHTLRSLHEMCPPPRKQLI